MSERRQIERKDFSYYMRLIDTQTDELVGHLVDVSTGGFKLDSPKPLPLEKDYRLHLDLTSEVAGKPFMVFRARSKWCHSDPLDPFVYNVGFQITEITPTDMEIFNRIVEKYGTQIANKRIDLRKSNIW
ncbi:MAG: PilZ domain-containing protein [Chloroflexota bacterium]